MKFDGKCSISTTKNYGGSNLLSFVVIQIEIRVEERSKILLLFIKIWGGTVEILNMNSPVPSLTGFYRIE